MDQTVTTVFFDGQFWIALVEKIGQDGAIRVGKFVFGAEPTNNDLRDFYLHKYVDVETFASAIHIRVKEKRSPREQGRSTAKSKDAFKDAQKAHLEERKTQARQKAQLDDREKYLAKAGKKKEKRKGH